MLEYIAPVLIFISLGVIIYIIGKHLPELRKFDDTKNKEEDKNETKKAKIAICKGGRLCRDGAIFVIEAAIKKMKQLMHLIHFWILKVKKDKSNGSEASREIEVKRELMEAEEENLDRILNEDLAEEKEDELLRKNSFDPEQQQPEEINKAEKSEINQEKLEDELEKEGEGGESDLEGKIGSFFSSKKQEKEEFWEENEIDEDEQKEEPKSFLGKFLSKFSKKKEKEADADSYKNDKDFFSDGIVDVKEVEAGGEKTGDNLIKEVVPAKQSKKKEANDIDEEIGVDRSILEKKIVQKIANNPKDIENYRELGDLYIKMKSYTEAEECYKQVLKIHVRDADAKRKIEKVRLLKRMG